MVLKTNLENYQGIAFGTKLDQPIYFNVRGTDIKCSEEVNLLGIYIDYVMYIIAPHLQYKEAITKFNLPTIKDRLDILNSNFSEIL